jgi:hypothetical protein
MEDVTYRLVVIDKPGITGRTAASPKLAKLVAGNLAQFRDRRLGLEQTDWGEHFGKPRVIRTVLIDAEIQPGEWTLG